MKKKTENEKKLERAKVNVHIEWTNVAQLAFFRSLSLSLSSLEPKFEREGNHWKKI